MSRGRTAMCLCSPMPCEETNTLNLYIHSQEYTDDIMCSSPSVVGYAPQHVLLYAASCVFYIAPTPLCLYLVEIYCV